MQIFNFHVLTGLVFVIVMLCTLLIATYQAIAAELRPVIPAHGSPIFNGNCDRAQILC